MSTQLFYTLSLHDALPICSRSSRDVGPCRHPLSHGSRLRGRYLRCALSSFAARSEEHTSELQSRGHLVCRLLLEKKKLRKMIRALVLNSVTCTYSIWYFAF